MENKNLLIGLGVLLAVVLVGAGFFLFSGGGYTPAPVPTQQVSAPAGEEAQEMVSQPQEQVREVEVVGDEYSFSPASITATAGEKLRVTFTNSGSLPHNFTIAELGVATKTISPGESDTVEFTVEADKTLNFYCSVGSHRQLGMEGNLEIVR